MREFVGGTDIASRLQSFLKAVEEVQRDPSVPASVKVALHDLAMMTNDPYPLRWPDDIESAHDG